MTSVRCPICKKTFDSDKSPALPFCSHRCRLIDLGKWLDEKRGLPYVSESPPEEVTEEPRDDE